jgi:5-formyltetrahydrofolate cyclo-ligase
MARIVGDYGESVTTAKAELRQQLLAARRARPPRCREIAGIAIAVRLLAAPELVGAATVAAHADVGGEPPTTPLLDGLRNRGLRVLLPVLLSDSDLDWAEYGGRAELAPAGRGLLEPTGPRLGIGAIEEADVVVCPGLAVGRDGMRLGRGGGSYDRALSRAAGAWSCVLLYDEELLDAVPVHEHDQAVSAAVTPSAGITRF